MRLVLPPETKGGERKKYTFQQLQDLQSKLMLVAGKAEKGKDDVDTFTEVLPFAGFRKDFNTMMQ